MVSGKSRLAHFFLHGVVADDHGPDVGAGLGDHQHPDHGDHICPQHHGDVEAEAQHNGHPHPTESGITGFPGTLVEQNDDQQTHEGKGDVPVDAPGQGGVGTEPVVLGHHAQDDPQSGQSVNGDGGIFAALHMVARPPDVVENHVEDGHGDGGDPLAQTQSYGEAFQTRGTQGQCPGDQVEGIAAAQQHGHNAKEGELTVALAATDHLDSESDNGTQINGVKYGFNNCLHRDFPFKQ